MAAVELVGRGAVPLGMRAGRLRDQGGVCVTEEVPQPFGATTPPSPAGHVPLTAAPPHGCLLYTSPNPRDRTRSCMPSSA